MSKAFKDFEKNLNTALSGMTMALGKPADKIKTIFVNKTKRLTKFRKVITEHTKEVE